MGDALLASHIPDPVDYVVRQHSLISVYLSLQAGGYARPGEEETIPKPKRQAIAALSLLLPFWLSLILSGNWFKCAAIAAVVTTAALIAFRRILASEVATAVWTIPKAGVAVSIWPHGVTAVLGFLALWSTFGFVFGSSRFALISLWLFTMAVLAGGEMVLRGVLYYFRWWPPALAGLAPVFDGGFAGPERGPVGYVPPPVPAAHV
ncbi:unnamed protein product [Phaeothamnion confervicola]